MFESGEEAPKDENEAARWYRRAADRGHANAEVRLGVLCWRRSWNSQGSKADKNEAMAWFRKAAARGSSRGQYELALRLEVFPWFPEQTSSQEQLKEAVEWYRKAAKRGSAAAALQLYWLDGNHSTQLVDDAEAVRWLRQAAEQGDPVAQYTLGETYDDVFRLAPPNSQALVWYQKAAEQGHSDAMYAIADIYLDGYGVPQNEIEGIRWLRRSAENGNFIAQDVLCRGPGTMAIVAATLDPRLRYAYCCLAARNGQTSARRERDARAMRLSNEERQAAQQAATDWYNAQKERGCRGSAESSTLFPVDCEVRPQGALAEGTGFFIGRRGQVVTNAHLIEGCTSVSVVVSGVRHSASIAARDSANDIALLTTDVAGVSGFSFRDGARMRLGEEVLVLGFPLGGVLSSEGGVTTGVVSALAGPGDDSRLFQMTAPVQPGNSGGPVLDRSGNLVGIATAKLDAGVMAAATGDIPDNVAFAIRAELLRTFLSSRGIEFETSGSRRTMAVVDIADQAKAFTAKVECLP